ncbi:hypothetical protein RhiirC2_785293 [Rhizophagus irregularis]|uniref:Uncharacterized protein n=1 Tax=Rhizophagus irregularis TaxID=588596 RepID=A0A2N1MWU7_9GLOM|nr:hypothetical protein RhiirC2_785293 [Rhizophagus irregularis]
MEGIVHKVPEILLNGNCLNEPLGVIKESIKSAFQMNILVEHKKKEREKEVILDYFKIQIENQECYSNLKLDEVLLNIYNRQTVSQSKNFQLVQENRYLKGQVARLERNNEELKKDKKPWHGWVSQEIIEKSTEQNLKSYFANKNESGQNGVKDITDHSEHIIINEISMNNGSTDWKFNTTNAFNK